jgi:hypothetical protein
LKILFLTSLILAQPAFSKTPKTEAGVCIDCEQERAQKTFGAEGLDKLMPLKNFIQLNSSFEISTAASEVVQNLKSAGLSCDEKSLSRGAHMSAMQNGGLSEFLKDEPKK